MIMLEWNHVIILYKYIEEIAHKYNYMMDYCTPRPMDELRFELVR